MKKKGIIAIPILALLISFLVIIFLCKNNHKYIMNDGMMLALTLDGKGIISLPTRGKYEVEIDCGDTARGKWLAEEWKLVVENITGNVKCNINFTTNSSTLKSKVESKAKTYENGYRYSGKQPDNWIWFNGEKWRIIGSIPTTLADNTVTNLVKIIRNESMGELIYQKSGGTVDTWLNTLLYTLLNTKYYGKLDATGAEPCFGGNDNNIYAKALCNYENTGISSSSTDYYGRMIKDVYWNVGVISDLSTDISTTYNIENKTKTSVTGKIGLMNASDYGYATSGINYSSIDLDSLNYYEQNNWLFKYSSEWLINQGGSKKINFVNESGRLDVVETYTYSHVANSVRPVVYLDSSVYIISGDGTEGNPYQIGM